MTGCLQVVNCLFILCLVCVSVLSVSLLSLYRLITLDYSNTIWYHACFYLSLDSNSLVSLMVASVITGLLAQYRLHSGRMVTPLSPSLRNIYIKQ